MKRRILKGLAFAAALALTAGVLVFAGSLLGNPVSRFLARRTAERYIAQQYPDSDFYIESVRYNFKFGEYNAHVLSPTSVDSHFTLSLSMTGRLQHDSYAMSVTSRWNTWTRLETEYRGLTDAVFDSPDFPFDLHIAYGGLWMEQEYGEPAPPALDRADLVVDGDYDIRRLGAECGRLCVYVREDVVSAERAAELLVAINAQLEDANVPFYCIDFVLQHPLQKDGTLPDESIEVRYFLREDIDTENLVERVIAADAEAKAYHAARDQEDKKEDAAQQAAD